jgi:hypothetical protein
MIEPLGSPFYPTTPYPTDEGYAGGLLGVMAEVWDEVTDLPNPFYNNGVSYKTENFVIQSFIWDLVDDDEDERVCALKDPPNFLYIPEGAAASWYKHYRRGVTCNEAFQNIEVMTFLKHYKDEVLSNLPPKYKGYVYKGGRT